MTLHTYVIRLWLPRALVAGLCSIASAASAQEWRYSDFGPPATLPDFDNDGPGNRMGRSTCNFVMNRSGTYQASLVVYQQRGFAPYGYSTIQGRDWEILALQGLFSAYDPGVVIANQCMNPADPTVHEGFRSEWMPLSLNEPSPSFACPPHMPVLVQSWCMTSVFW